MHLSIGHRHALQASDAHRRRHAGRFILMHSVLYAAPKSVFDIFISQFPSLILLGVKMLRLSLRSRVEKVALVVFVLVFALASYHLFHYDDSHIHNLFLPTSSSTTTEVEQPLGVLRDGIISFPATHLMNETIIRHHLENTTSKDWDIVQIQPEQVRRIAPLEEAEFSPHQGFSFYQSKSDPRQGTCDELPDVLINSLQVSPRKPIPCDFKDIFNRIIFDYEVEKDPYYQDIAPLMMKHIRVEVQQDFIKPYWFRLSGSSVWLKDHNVHFVVSRFIFAKNRNKSDPLLSLTLAQIFDENWNELKDIRLVFPTRKVTDTQTGLEDETAPVFKIGAQRFSLYKFPRALPIPFFHDYGKKGGNLFGAEDPRVMLVRNPEGYEEPLIVFNAKHVKAKGDTEDDVTNLRSMFYTLPFQLQKGKKVDIVKEPKAANKWFTRTKRILVPGDDGATKKNWTPLLSSYSSYGSNSYDETISFVSQLEALKIVQCNLYSEDERCDRVYELKGGVGALRGGTPFLNIKNLIGAQFPALVDKIFPPFREVYVGVARAHLSGCGCGSFYRPNLVVITKDRASYYDQDKNEKRTQFFYKVAYVSSSMSLGVTIDPWVPNNPKTVCSNVNALIPNGIAGWTIHSLEPSDERWTVSDTMSLGISVSDNSVDRLSLTGVLDVVLNGQDKSLFYHPRGPQLHRDMGFPELDKNGQLIPKLFGFDDGNIHCAMDTSGTFCRTYSQQQKEIADQLGDIDLSKEEDEFKKSLQAFETALENFKNPAKPKEEKKIW